MSYKSKEEAVREYVTGILYKSHKIPDTPWDHIEFLAVTRLGCQQIVMPDGRVVKVDQLHRESPDILIGVIARLEVEVFERDGSPGLNPCERQIVKI